MMRCMDTAHGTPYAGESGSLTFTYKNVHKITHRMSTVLYKLNHCFKIMVKNHNLWNPLFQQLFFSLNIHIRRHMCNYGGDNHEPLARYVKLRVAHVPSMSGTFSPPPCVSYPDMHHGTCVTHVSWCMLGSLSLNSGFLWSRWRGKRSQHSRRMRNPQFYVSGKRSMVSYLVG